MIREYDLSGEWRFSLKDDRLDDRIGLPGTTAQARKGAVNQKRETERLTEVYPFEGKAYYERRVHIRREDVGRPLLLFLERTRKTKVWVDGQMAGERDSLCAPHIYELTDLVKAEEFTLRIQVENTDYLTKGGHLTSPDTQTNWNGITGRIALEVYGEVSIRHVKARSDIENWTAELELEVENAGSEVCRSLSVTPYLRTVGGIEGEGAGGTMKAELVLPHGRSVQKVVYVFDTQPLFWSEYQPVLYHFRLTWEGEGEAEETGAEVGMRCFQAGEHAFLINGKEVKLRGKHEGLSFPLTGAAPTRVEEWLHIMGIARRYGINHYRCHTCCPPEAAFEAADLLGIYLEPELPFWGTITEPDEENHNEAEQEYLIQEGIRILRAYGNHPSFCMLSMGNELWGSPKRIGQIIRRLRDADDRPLYTQGSNNFQFTPMILPEEDFWVGVRLSGSDENGENKRLLRGSYAMCDAPQGHIQTREPSTMHDYDAAILPPEEEEEKTGNGLAGQEIEIQYGTSVKKVRASETGVAIRPSAPVVTHEIGQYAVFPNFEEIKKFTGVTRARNLEVFKERLEEKGMGHLAKDFFYNSGKLAIQCYKEELEAAHRSRYVAGYQILDIQDFQGQGTALVGILDAMMDSKGLVEEEEWRSFCSDEVLLARFERYNYYEGEPFRADIEISYYNQAQELLDKRVAWTLEAEGCSYAQGEIRIPDQAYGLTYLGEISCRLPESGGEALQLRLSLDVEGTKIHKEYPLWIYPKNVDIFLPEESGCVQTGSGQVWVAYEKERASEWLAEGKAVLYMPEHVEKSVKGSYCTDFWNYPMFRRISEGMGKPVPVGTMGLLIRKEHPALRGFAKATYTTPQWYAVCQDCDCAVLDDLEPAGLMPTVQMIDNFERNHKLGILFEANVGKGSVLVCTAKLRDKMQRPEIRQLVKGLLDYAASDAFQPADTVDWNDWKKWLD